MVFGGCIFHHDFWVEVTMQMLELGSVIQQLTVSFIQEESLPQNYPEPGVTPVFNCSVFLFPNPVECCLATLRLQLLQSQALIH